MTNAESTASVASIAEAYDASIVVRRWLGAWLDFLILASFLLVPDYLLGNETYQATLVVWLCLVAAYFPVMESLLGGTVGKFITGTRVVNASGTNPSFFQSIVRTLFRLIEVNPLLVGGAPAGIAVLVSRHKQRLGDMVAHTYVLVRKDVRRIAQPELADNSSKPTALRDAA